MEMLNVILAFFVGSATFKMSQGNSTILNTTLVWNKILFSRSRCSFRSIGFLSFFYPLVIPEIPNMQTP